MTKKIKLLTSIADQDNLHLAEEAVRRTTATMSVDRRALINILIGQHGPLLAHMDAGNVTGLGNAHVANYSAAASVAAAPTVGSL
jgi:hypothetical protein